MMCLLFFFFVFFMHGITICKFRHAQTHDHARQYIIFYIFFVLNLLLFISASDWQTHSLTHSVARSLCTNTSDIWNDCSEREEEIEKIQHTCEELRTCNWFVALRFVGWLKWKFNYFIIIFVEDGQARELPEKQFFLSIFRCHFRGSGGGSL